MSCLSRDLVCSWLAFLLCDLTNGNSLGFSGLGVLGAKSSLSE